MTKPSTGGVSDVLSIEALYRRMLLIRLMEERLGEIQKTGALPGPVHLYIGQEAVAVGVCAHLTDRDWIASTHRGHGHFLAKGGDPRAMAAELYGRVTGICKGKGGSMHVADFTKGIIGANGIVGGGISLTTGAALAAQLDGQGDVAVAFFGDGAANQGVLSESLNLGALWDLPLILVCENNGFSEFSPTSTVTAGRIVDRARPYGVAAIEVDGNDIHAVLQAADEAVSRARSGNGPTLIEAQTYRLRGHVEYEVTFLSSSYREQAEVDLWISRDPMVRAQGYLREAGFDEASIKAIEAEITAVVDEAFEFAENSPWPDPSTALDDIFA
jgi:TPP-dependent pyruvate/acetoin dehydrogenase alpha subunit